MSDDSKQGTRKKIKKILSIFSNRESNLTNLLMRFILLVIVIILVLVALDIYLYNYQPIVLSKFQYSYYKNDVNLPPGISDSGGTGKNYLLAEQLAKCPAGFCALSKETGLKRCPDGNYQLVYNSLEEVCSRPDFCDFEDLPYAVRSDGTTSLSGKCDTGVPCRCTNQKSCDTGIVSPFETVFGSNFDPSQNNFTITQIPETNIQFGYTSITLTRSNTQVCQLNPGFTDKVTNGCDFTNSIRDKLDCQNISSQVPISITPGVSSNAAELTQAISIGQTSFISRKEQTDGTVYILDTLPNDGGYLEFSNSDRSKTELIFYNKKNNSSKSIITVSGVTHLESTPETTPYGTLGFGLSWPKGDTTIIKAFEIETKFCQSATDGPNFKNMLICTQNDRQPCLQGTLAYNFDKLNSNNTTTNQVLTSDAFSRNFCQQRSNTQDPQLRSNYLQDPAFYTVGCYLGDGCNNLKLDLNGEIGLKAAAGKYYPDVDVGGINGQWNILNIGYPVYKPSNDQTDLLIYNSVQPGDFWSIKSEGETLITNKISTSGTSTLNLYSLLSLNNYIGIDNINENIRPLINLSVGTSPQLSFSVVNCNFNKGQFSVNVTPTLPYDIPTNIDVKVNPLPFDNQGEFKYFGIITQHYDTVSNQPFYYFSDINGNIPSITIQEDIFNIVIFKQFSFSGGNYNTISFSNENNPVKRRVYSGSRNTPIFAKPSFGVQGVSAIIPPQNISNVFLNQADINFNPSLVSPISSFQGVQEPFKTSLSMYYPVWNPITFQQECVRCKPNLTSYLELGTNENIERVIIQYSGKDFTNYEYSVQSDGYVFTSTSKLDRKRFNTTKVFHLTEPNPNLQVGDMIMSLNLQFPVSIISTSGTSAGYKNGLGTSVRIIPQITYNDNNVLSPTRNIYGIEESQNDNYLIQKNITDGPGNQDLIVKENGNLNIEISPNGERFFIKDLKTSKPDGYCFGKIYRTSKASPDLPNIVKNDFGFYLFPNIGITNISDDGKTITTNSSLATDLVIDSTLDYSEYLQFCRVGKNLEINLVQDLGVPLSVTGTGESLKIDKISDGRITNISVLDGGSNFLQNTIPIVTLNNYDYYIT